MNKREYMAISHFVESCCDTPLPGEETTDYTARLDHLFRTWIWFVQTDEKLRWFFPCYMPVSKQAFGRYLKEIFATKTKLVRRSLKRNELSMTYREIQEARQDNPYFNPFKHYTVVFGLRLKYRQEWAGMNRPWYVLPFLPEESPVGNVINEWHPVALRWKEAGILGKRKDSKEGLEIKRWWIGMKLQEKGAFLEKMKIVLEKQKGWDVNRPRSTDLCASTAPSLSVGGFPLPPDDL